MINSNWTPVQLASNETIITQLFVKVCPLLSQDKSNQLILINDANQLRSYAYNTYLTVTFQVIFENIPVIP